MSKTAWETTSLTSLYTHYRAFIFSLGVRNDVGDVVSQALLLTRW